MLHTHKKITVVVPCFNESKAIGQVIQAFPTDSLKRMNWELEILVIDNNSTDGTSDVAKKNGASVILELARGKGRALLTGLRRVSPDTDYVVMLDGDNTYHPKELLRMIEPLDSDFCDAIVGSRIQGRMQDGAMSQTSRIGNWLFSFLVRYFYQVNVTDVLTGYFAWKKPALDAVLPHLRSTGFEIEMEMITKMARLGLEVYSVPISYHHRIGNSKLDHIRDGMIIFSTFIANLTWKPKVVVPKKKKSASKAYSKPYPAFSPE